MRELNVDINHLHQYRQHFLMKCDSTVQSLIAIKGKGKVVSVCAVKMLGEWRYSPTHF